jgi:hypothetical protein
VIVVEPSLKSIWPVAPVELTVAVYVTAWPTLDGLPGDELTVVVDAVVLTTSLKAVLTEPAKFVVPE